MPQHIKLRAVLCGALLIPATSAGAAVGTYTGGDVGEGLDLDGTFAYAVKVQENAEDAPVTIRDAVFTPDSTTPGVTLTGWASHIANWVGPNYGASANDQALATVVDTIRHVGTLPGTGSIDLAVTQGVTYKLQMMYQEGCCNRGFDIFVEGANAQDNFSTGPINGAPTSGTVFTHTFTAGDAIADIDLVGVAGEFPDTNPTLFAFTLEVVPEPTALGLLGAGALGALARRRSRA